MKRLSVFICMLLIGFSSFAQQGEKSIELEKVRKINFLYPGHEIENPLKCKLSWGYMVGSHIWFQASQRLRSDESTGFGFDYIDLVPTAELYGRWYYNIGKRASKKKRVQNNSASYLTMGTAVIVDGIRIIGNDSMTEEKVYYGIFTGWGMRRTFGKRIILDLHLKFQPTFEGSTYEGLALLPGLKLSYLLPSKKNLSH